MALLISGVLLWLLLVVAAHLLGWWLM